jgi:class 3 adenylate cyclase
VDCALCIRRLIADALNPELKQRGLPRLDIRVGLDAGEAAVRVLGSPTTKRHADIIGDVVSLACNIESAAERNEVLLGDTVERNLHVTWRQQCEPAQVPEDWALKGPDGEPYRLHRLGPDASRPIEAPPRRASD